jgi:hypothetical protein
MRARDGLSAGRLRAGARRAWLEEGGNLRIDWRWGRGDPSLFERYAAELVALGPEVLMVQRPLVCRRAAAGNQHYPDPLCERRQPR